MSKKTPKDELLTAAKRLRKTANSVNRFDERVLSWVPTLIPPDENHKRNTYWVDEHTVSESGGEGYRTVADCLWHVGDINYIAMMHPPVALLLASMFEATASWLNDGWGKYFSPDSHLGFELELAKEINKQWKVRAKHAKK